MIAHEADGAKQDLVLSRSGQLLQDRSGIGLQPGLRGAARALVGDTCPLAVPAQPIQHPADTRLQLAAVGVTVLEDPPRQAVRGEQQEHPVPVPRLEARQRVPHPVGDGVEEARVIVPLAHRRHLKRASPLFQGLLVGPDAQAGVMWRERDGHHPRKPVAGDAGQHVADVRVPVTHPDVDGSVISQQSRQCPRLFHAPLEQRRAAADPGVPPPKLLDHLDWGGSSATHVAQVGLHVFQALGRAVSHEEHGVARCGWGGRAGRGGRGGQGERGGLG